MRWLFEGLPSPEMPIPWGVWTVPLMGWMSFITAIVVIMIALGTVLDAIAVLLIVTPIVLPTLAGLGIDRVHFGIVLIINMEIAFLTPPIGLNLFVLSNIAEAPIAETIRGVAPFVALLFCFLLVIMFFPELSLWLPRVVYG